MTHQLFKKPPRAQTAALFAVAFLGLQAVVDAQQEFDGRDLQTIFESTERPVDEMEPVVRDKTSDMSSTTPLKSQQARRLQGWSFGSIKEALDGSLVEPEPSSSWLDPETGRPSSSLLNPSAGSFRSTEEPESIEVTTKPGDLKETTIEEAAAKDKEWVVDESGNWSFSSSQLEASSTFNSDQKPDSVEGSNFTGETTILTISEDPFNSETAEFSEGGSELWTFASRSEPTFGSHQEPEAVLENPSRETTTTEISKDPENTKTVEFAEGGGSWTFASNSDDLMDMTFGSHLDPESTQLGTGELTQRTVTRDPEDIPVFEQPNVSGHDDDLFTFASSHEDAQELLNKARESFGSESEPKGLEGNANGELSTTEIFNTQGGKTDFEDVSGGDNWTFASGDQDGQDLTNERFSFGSETKPEAVESVTRDTSSNLRQSIVSTLDSSSTNEYENNSGGSGRVTFTSNNGNDKNLFSFGSTERPVDEMEPVVRDKTSDMSSTTVTYLENQEEYTPHFRSSLDPKGRVTFSSSDDNAMDGHDSHGSTSHDTNDSHSSDHDSHDTSSLDKEGHSSGGHDSHSDPHTSDGTSDPHTADPHTSGGLDTSKDSHSDDHGDSHGDTHGDGQGDEHGEDAGSQGDGHGGHGSPVEGEPSKPKDIENAIRDMDLPDFSSIREPVGVVGNDNEIWKNGLDNAYANTIGCSWTSLTENLPFTSCCKHDDWCLSGNCYMRQYCSDYCEQSEEEQLKENGACCKSARDCASEFCFRGTCVKSCLHHAFINMKPIGSCCEEDSECESGGCRGDQCVNLPTAEELAIEKIEFNKKAFQMTLTLAVLGAFVCVLSCMLSLYLYMRRTAAADRTNQRMKQYARASGPYENKAMKLGPGIYDQSTHSKEPSSHDGSQLDKTREGDDDMSSSRQGMHQPYMNPSKRRPASMIGKQSPKPGVRGNDFGSEQNEGGEVSVEQRMSTRVKNSDRPPRMARQPSQKSPSTSPVRGHQ